MAQATSRQVNDVARKASGQQAASSLTRGAKSIQPDSSSSIIDADYVIVFSLARSVDKDGTSSKASHAMNIKSEYSNMMGQLKNAGLVAVGRHGRKGKEEILVLVKAPRHRLLLELERECTTDWLHGVNSTNPSERNVTPSEITEAARLRHTYNIITQSTPSGSSSSASTMLALAGPGAGITPMSAQFRQIKAIIPLHDPEFNKMWLSKWSDKSRINIPMSDFDEIKDHFGEAIAFYFAFLRTYFRWLTVPTVLGSLTWLLGWNYSTFYATVLVLWSTTFVEYWRVKERLLAVRWKTYNSLAVEWPRAEFLPTRLETDSVTGEKVGRFPWWKTEVRGLATIPILLAFVVGLLTLICGITVVEVLLNEVYNGPAKKYTSLLPTVLFVGLVPQIVGLWQKVALGLVGYENHALDSHHNRSLTLKMFTLNAIVAYTGLFITAFIYVPFGSLIVPYLATIVHTFVQKDAVPVDTNHLDKASLNWSTYSINNDRLHTQLFAYTVTNQVIGAFTEVGLPFLKSFFGNKVEQYQENKAAKKAGGPPSPLNEDGPVEKAFMDRVRREVDLPEYTLFSDFAEMTIQFGYISVWTVVWPIAPLFALVNNFFELRTDSYKLTTQTRRPVPARTDTIGPWLDALGVVTWVGAMMNAALVYIFRPNPSDPSSLTSQITANVHGAIPSQNHTVIGDAVNHVKGKLVTNVARATDSATPAYALRGVLFSALLVALASEHGYLLARHFIRHVIERVTWKDSEAEKERRVLDYKSKRSFLDTMNVQKKGDAFNEKRSEGQEYASLDDERFWTKGDLGMGEIERVTKTE